MAAPFLDRRSAFVGAPITPGTLCPVIVVRESQKEAAGMLEKRIERHPAFPNVEKELARERRRIALKRLIRSSPGDSRVSTTRSPDLCENRHPCGTSAGETLGWGLIRRRLRRAHLPFPAPCAGPGALKRSAWIPPLLITGAAAVGLPRFRRESPFGGIVSGKRHSPLLPRHLLPSVPQNRFR